MSGRRDLGLRDTLAVVGFFDRYVAEPPPPAHRAVPDASARAVAPWPESGDADVAGGAYGPPPHATPGPANVSAYTSDLQT